MTSKPLIKHKNILVLYLENGKNWVYSIDILMFSNFYNLIAITINIYILNAICKYAFGKKKETSGAS